MQSVFTWIGQTILTGLGLFGLEFLYYLFPWGAMKTDTSAWQKAGLFFLPVLIAAVYLIAVHLLSTHTQIRLSVSVVMTAPVAAIAFALLLDIILHPNFLNPQPMDTLSLLIIAGAAAGFVWVLGILGRLFGFSR